MLAFERFATKIDIVSCGSAETLDSTYRSVCGQDPAGGSGEAVPLAGGDELLHGTPVGRQADE